MLLFRGGSRGGLLLDQGSSLDGHGNGMNLFEGFADGLDLGTTTDVSVW